jgi:Plant transposon protein
MLFFVVGWYVPVLLAVCSDQIPICHCQQQLTAWQEGARKDIECAFGALKGQFQFVEQPMQFLLLHNIC